MDLEKDLTQHQRQRLDRLVVFLRANRNHPRSHRRHHVAKLVRPGWSARRKMVAIFSAAVSSDPGNNLTDRAAAVQSFLDVTQDLGNARQISRDRFLGCFGTKTVNGVFDWLTDVRGVKNKKAALFVRDLYVTQGLPPQSRVFTDRALRRTELWIPLDIVIANVINRMFPPHTFRSPGHLGSLFLEFDAWARRAVPGNHMLLEDLWFWGYFCLRNRTGAAAAAVSYPQLRRVVGFNRDKYLMDAAFDHEPSVPEHFSQFINLVRER